MLRLLQGCVGINVQPLARYPVADIAGHEFVNIPGGFTVIGSGEFQDATPHWVQLSPYAIGRTSITESQYREVMGSAGNEKVPEDHPVTMVLHGDALEYLRQRGGGLRLSTEVEWENAARGPAVDMRKIMEEETGSFRPNDFVDFAEGRFENFVFDVLGKIVTDPKNSEPFRELIEQGIPFFGWRVYGTPSGKLTHQEAWFDQREQGTASADWGPANAYGLKGMTGGVWERCQDWYSLTAAYLLGGLNPIGPETGDYRVVRGGSWCNDGYPRGLRAAFRSNDHPEGRDIDIGFRPAVALQDFEK